MTETLVIERVAPEELHDLRRRVLRGGRPEAIVVNASDAAPQTRHYAGRLEGRVVVSASFFLAEGPQGATHQLRYMATDPRVQGRGYGRRVLDFAEADLAGHGVRRVWANARDTALGFYRACSWRVLLGSEHVSAETQIPHTVILKDLNAPRE